MGQRPLVSRARWFRAAAATWKVAVESEAVETATVDRQTLAPADGRLARLVLAARRIGLPAWFVAVDLLWVAKDSQLAIDALDYQKATAAWLAGADPWAVPGLRFAAGPHLLPLYLPTAGLPPLLAAAIWTAAGALAAAWLVRRLGLAPWWFFFPPLFHATWNANPETIALALLVQGGSLAAVTAVAIKYYAVIPLLARPRLLAVAIAGVVMLAPFLPIERYVADGLGLSDHLATAWNGSAMRLPILIPVVIAALWVLRRRGAEWLAVPALWPATQFYYVAMALPAVARRPLAAALLALPAPLMAPLLAIGLAALELRRRT